MYAGLAREHMRSRASSRPSRAPSRVPESADLRRHNTDPGRVAGAVTAHGGCPAEMICVMELRLEAAPEPRRIDRSLDVVEIERGS